MTTDQGWNPDRSINLLFGVTISLLQMCATAFFAKISSRESGYFLEAVVQKKGTFVMLQNLRHNSSNLFDAKRKKSLDEIKPWDLCFCLFRACTSYIATGVMREVFFSFFFKNEIFYS